jgi:hypothetical protein
MERLDRDLLKITFANRLRRECSGRTPFEGRKTPCFERASLQSCRNGGAINAGFTGCGKRIALKGHDFSRAAKPAKSTRALQAAENALL